ncbi:MAG TPA: hypothetical protein VML50_17570 [Anaeromyxobacter sp.]|nr:hypothetical protein [Anaeromyxobacter sp.]
MTAGVPHLVQWVTPLPLWSASPAAMQAPALLRFETDRFMEELQAALAAKVPDLSGFVARWESFRERYPGEPDDPPGLTPKLYQPAHGRFYLVAASLVCRQVGLPDRAVDPTRSESVSFVLRRLDPAGDEEGWVADPADATKRVWSAAGDPTTLAPGEDTFPLFPIRFTADGRGRRLLVGLVPTSSRETFESAAAFAAPDAEGNPFVAEARARVVDPYRALRAMQPGATSEIEKAEEDQRREASQFLLLDLADVLQARLPALWKAIGDGAPPAAGDPGGDLYALLGTGTEGPSARSWRSAAVAAWNGAAHIFKGDGQSGVHDDLGLGTLDPDALDAALAKALGPLPAPAAAAAPTPVPKLEARGQTLYVLRCVYQRPRCGPLRPAVLSQPSARFTLAPFFDADAPGRPIRIVLPDPSIASLRRFKKNVGMVTNAALRKQMARVAGLDDAMKGNFSAPGSGIALDEICTFSIPIITLCAFIVLMIFLILLNLAFWWLPFLKICFPILKPAPPPSS